MWRCALVPPCPALLVFTDDDAYAASLPTRRSFELTAITVFVLLNPVVAVEILLPPLIYYGHEDGVRRVWVSKVVFTPSPAKDDFAAAAICDLDRIAYVTAGAKRWAVMDPVRLTSEKDQLTDVVYTDKGKVYCLTKCGDVHVLCLPERRRRKPANADEAGLSLSLPKFSFLRPSPPVGRVTILRSRRLEQQNDFLTVVRTSDQELLITLIRYKVVPPESSQGPHLDAPATVEPLLPLFDPATVFAPPYDTVSAFTSAKNLVFCEGNLYQVWRNTSCTVTLKLPAGGQHRVAENEILVLRYYPQCQCCCWDVVKDLGGYSFFEGSNNAVSMYAEGVPGLTGNCV
ncbi:unnamed protein product [Miscanthus lutarioriparius]|uniref:KIB1-4 beta-propeller domain-containing protein n=1 Tax=Miscanthus lutarioriparius TaxID=422564 RepID=A0A811NI14_9POAL|nr:unnamed protein product [Miscanthus lutarioriparius]